MTTIPYVATSKDGVNSISAYVEGKLYVVFKSDFDEYEKLLLALENKDYVLAKNLIDKYEGARAFAIGIPGLTFNEKSLDESEPESFYKYEDKAITGEFHQYIEKVRSSENPEALRKFFALLETNPQPQSRKYLFEFLQRHKIEVAPDGTILFYKGVDEAYTSGHKGRGWVNGVLFESAHLDNKIGNHIFLEREAVDLNPNIHCSTGLHVASRSFASSYRRVLVVKVNPADVVAVTNDHSYAKVRCTQYVVVGEVSSRNLTHSAEAGKPPHEITDAMRNYDASKVFQTTPDSARKTEHLAIEKEPADEKKTVVKKQSVVTEIKTKEEKKPEPKVVKLNGVDDVIKALQAIETVYRSRDSRISSENRIQIRDIISKAVKSRIITDKSLLDMKYARKYHLTAILDKIRPKV